MPTDLRLRIQGNDGEKLAALLKKSLKNANSQQAIELRTENASDASDAKCADVLGALTIASFVLSIPGYFLSYQSLKAKIESQSKLEKLTKQTQRLADKQDATVWIEIADKPYEFIPENIDVIQQALLKNNK